MTSAILSQYVELCDDCKIDYNEIDEVREDFNKVLVEGKQTEMSTKNLIILVTTGIFGAILVGLFIKVYKALKFALGFLYAARGIHQHWFAPVNCI